MGSIIIINFLGLHCIHGDDPKSLDGTVDLVHSHLQVLVLGHVLDQLLRFHLVGRLVVFGVLVDSDELVHGVCFHRDYFCNLSKIINSGHTIISDTFTTIPSWFSIIV